MYTIGKQSKIILNPRAELLLTCIFRMVNIGGLAALGTTLLERYVGFWAAYLTPLCVLGLGMLPLVLWRNKFSKYP